MSSDITPDVSALAINVRLLPDGRLAAKAYGQPAGGGRGTYVSFPVPDRPELAALVAKAASRAGALWAAHRGLSLRPSISCRKDGSVQVAGFRFRRGSIGPGSGRSSGSFIWTGT